VATITDTNDAQAKYDQIVAQQVAVSNDLDNKRAALRAIIGRFPGDLRGFGGRLPTDLPLPDPLDLWLQQAVAANLQVRIAQASYDIAALEVERQRAARLPVLDLVASFNQAYAGAAASPSISATFPSDSRLLLVGVQASMPIYEGGLIQSRVRQAIANQDVARQNLESARRNAELVTQSAYTGVSGGAAQVRALEQALKSAQVSYESTRLGLEVGVRTNLDVLNQQQQVFQTRFNLAQAYYNYLVSGLRLKAAAGTLREDDIAAINRDLRG
jgi:outer membrane protein